MESLDAEYFASAGHRLRLAQRAWTNCCQGDKLLGKRGGAVDASYFLSWLVSLTGQPFTMLAELALPCRLRRSLELDLKDCKHIKNQIRHQADPAPMP